MEIVKVSVTALLFRGLPDRGRLDQPPKNKLDLNRLRARMGEKPRTKVGANPTGVAGHQGIIRRWAQPERHLDVAERNRNRDRLCAAIGLYWPAKAPRSNRRARCDVAVASLASHPSTALRCPLRLRMRREKARRESQRSPTPNDPLANIREREDRRSGFQYNSEPDVKKLI